MGTPGAATAMTLHCYDLRVTTGLPLSIPPKTAHISMVLRDIRRTRSVGTTLPYGKATTRFLEMSLCICQRPIRRCQMVTSCAQQWNSLIDSHATDISEPPPGADPRTDKQQRLASTDVSDSHRISLTSSSWVAYVTLPLKFAHVPSRSAEMVIPCPIRQPYE